jgi:hypothetical protein
VDLRESQITLFRKFAHLYDSGVPLPDALEIARAEVGEPLQGTVQGIVAELYAGTSLADAMEKRQEAFSPEIIGIIRAGEERGELGQAALSAASGLKERFLEPRRVAEAEVDAMLESAGDAHFLHLEPSGQLRIRTANGLSDGGEVDTANLAAALARRAGIGREAGHGAFLWRNRLVRVALSPTRRGPATVVRLSAEPGPEPAEARAWREARPGLLVVLGGRAADKDSCLRSILAAFDPQRTKRVAIDLPAPEAVAVADLEAAVAQDPDVVCLAHLMTMDEAARCIELVAEGIHIVVGSSSLRPFEGAAYRTIRVV